MQLVPAFSRLQTVPPVPKRGSLLGLFVGLVRLIEALGELAQVLKKESRNADFHNEYGYVLPNLGHNDQAADELTTAIRLKPNSAGIHYNFAMFLRQNILGVVHMWLGQVPEAVEQFNEALRMHPGDADAAENLRLALASGEAG